MHRNLSLGINKLCVPGLDLFVVWNIEENNTHASAGQCGMLAAHYSVIKSDCAKYYRGWYFDIWNQTIIESKQGAHFEH